MKRVAVVLGRKTIFVLLVLSLAVPFYGQPAQADLVTNGSFENPGFSDPTALNLAVGNTSMEGWTVINAALAWIKSPNFGLTASDGGYFLDLTGYHDSAPYGGVQQTINTVIGQQYELGFDLGSSTTYLLPSAINVSAGLTSQNFISTNTSSTNAWEHFTMLFTASGTTTDISLTGSQAGPSGNGKYIGLDNVTVSAIPVPPTALLLGSGLMGLGLLRFRKRA